MPDSNKKAWVVTLSKKRYIKGKKVINVDTKYVRAKTPEGAVRTAKLYSFLKGVKNASHQVRAADPIRDLGCVLQKMPEIKV